jgi:hypothetical protein
MQAQFIGGLKKVCGYIYKRSDAETLQWRGLTKFLRSIRAKDSNVNVIAYCPEYFLLSIIQGRQYIQNIL